MAVFLFALIQEWYFLPQGQDKTARKRSSSDYYAWDVFPFLVGRLGAVQKPYLLNRVSSKIKSGSLRLRASDLPRKLSLTEGPASSALSFIAICFLCSKLSWNDGWKIYFLVG